MADIDKIKKVKQLHEDKWLALDGVVAVGIGLVQGDRGGIIISVEANRDTIREQIPSEVEGVPVKVQVTGHFEAQ